MEPACGRCGSIVISEALHREYHAKTDEVYNSLIDWVVKVKNKFDALIARLEVTDNREVPD